MEVELDPAVHGRPTHWFESRAAWINFVTAVLALFGSIWGWQGKAEAGRATAESAALAAHVATLNGLIGRTAEAQRQLEGSLDGIQKAIHRMQAESGALVESTSKRIDAECSRALKHQSDITTEILSRVRQEVADKVELLRVRIKDAEAAATSASAAAAIARAVAGELSRTPANPTADPPRTPSMGPSPLKRPSKTPKRISISGSGNRVVLEVPKGTVFLPAEDYVIEDKGDRRIHVAPGSDILINITGSRNILYIPEDLRPLVSVEDMGRDNSVQFFQE
ncbi:MAG: hypothetical protein L6R43_00590 [Planctomycetes bacterium]|nr:hypothetical protein [Planctomycetota bacterium]